MTSTKTRLEVANTVLLSVGERPISASGSVQGQLVSDCIKQALIDVCTSAAWGELRDSILGTWSGDTASLADTVYKIGGVFWYSSPTGSPGASYDYSRYPVEFVTLDKYLKFPLTPYTTSSQNTPRYYTLEDTRTVRVNPYPNDSTERNKITFDVYKLVAYPSTDSNYFTCSDQFLTVIEYKAASLFALKFLGDINLSRELAGLSEVQRRRNLVNDNNLPSGGYYLHRGRRR
jgi:hypothetical protein